MKRWLLFAALTLALAALGCPALAEAEEAAGAGERAEAVDGARDAAAALEEAAVPEEYADGTGTGSGTDAADETSVAPQTPCWTTREENYYHLDAHCGGARRYPLTVGAALAFEKVPCPLCAEEEQPMTGTERWGTYVFAIPQQAVERACLGEADRSEIVEEVRRDGRAWLNAMCPEALEGAEGAVEGTARIAQPADEAGVLVMCARRIGDRWYLVLRPDAPYGEGRPLRWQAAEVEYRLEADGTLTLRQTALWPVESVVESPNMNDALAVLEAAYVYGDAQVYHQMDVDIAVVHWQDQTLPVEEHAVLCVGGEGDGVPVQGYDGGQAASEVYCAVLTPAETAKLETVPSLKFPNLAARASFERGPYAPVQLSQEDGYRLVDASGALDGMECRRILTGLEEANSGEDLPPVWFCLDAGDALVARDGRTLEILWSLPVGEPFLSLRYENPRLAIVEWADRMEYCEWFVGADGMVSVRRETVEQPAAPDKDGLLTRAGLTGVYTGFFEGEVGFPPMVYYTYDVEKAVAFQDVPAARAAGATAGDAAAGTGDDSDSALGAIVAGDAADGAGASDERSGRAADEGGDAGGPEASDASADEAARTVPYSREFMEAAGVLAMLVDEDMGAISQPCRYIEPLIWRDDGGVFLFEPMVGAPGRLGLMDQNGEVLVEPVYAAIRPVSARRVELVDESGVVCVQMLGEEEAPAEGVPDPGEAGTDDLPAD